MIDSFTKESAAIVTRHLAIAIIASVCGLQSCGPSMPECPYRAEQAAVASAGCLLNQGSSLLVVAGFNNRISVPGGGSAKGEAPRCTAHRETWEETGLEVTVGKLEQVFDTGFHLYRCQLATTEATIDPPMRLEVRRAWFLPLPQFSEFEWRYPYQQALMDEWMRKQNPEPEI
ncbi:MAG: 8-oxo-dGTP diphosphatase [Paraglaciecola psychrophila]|jgi:8-oxo-dGTP diphosphatase